MEQDKIEQIYQMINNIPITKENAMLIEETKQDLLNKDYIQALRKLEKLSTMKQPKAAEKVVKAREEKEEKNKSIYPAELSNIPLEHTYMGLLLNDPKQIVKFYFLFQDCYFEDPEILNIYKSVLFTEGGAYTPEIAKAGFNFSKDSEEVYKLKGKLKLAVQGKRYNMEKIYIELKKIFALRKSYLAIPIKNIQEKVVEITEYDLYDQMSVEEVESAIVQVNDNRKV